MPCPQSKRYIFSFTTGQYAPMIVRLMDGFQKDYCMYLIYRRDSELLDGFFTLKKKLSVTGVCKGLFVKEPSNIKKTKAVKGLHLEPAKGTSKSLTEYYSRDGEYVEFGETPYPGKRGVKGKKRSVRRVTKSPPTPRPFMPNPNIEPYTREWYQQFPTHADLNAWLELEKPVDRQPHHY